VADPREAWIAGRGRRSIEDARRKAAANTPEVMMSQTADWYQNRENLARAKDALQGIDAVTTDQDESRNMYQMLMNQMKGGDRGARLVDKSGTTYNPFPKAGFGSKFYKKEFPIASGLGSLMEGAENFMPGIGMAKRMFGKERTPLSRDPKYTPVHGSADWESSIFDLTGDYDVDTGYGWEDDGLSGYPGYNDPVTITDLMEPEFEGVAPPEDEIFTDAEIFNKNFELWTPFGDSSDYPEMFAGAKTAYEYYKLLEEAHGIRGEELLQKMIDEKVIKERIDDDLPISKDPEELRFEDKVKSMSLEELEGLIEDQEFWSGDRIDI